MRRKFSLLLPHMLALCALLSACGAPAVEDGGAESAVYVPVFTELIRDSRDPVDVLGFWDGLLYISRWEKVGESAPEGVSADFEGQFDVYEPFLYRLDRGGDLVRLPAYQPLGAPPDDGHPGFSAGCELCGLCAAPDGLVTVELSYAYWSDGEADSESGDLQEQYYEQTYYLRVLDRDGLELSRAPLQVSEDTWLQTGSMLTDSAGNLLLLADGALRAFGPDGAAVYTVGSDIVPERLLRLSDGRIAVISDSNTGKICLLDEKTRTLTAAGSFDARMENAVPGAGSNTLCFTDGDGFYSLRIGEKQAERLFSLSGVNIGSADFLPLAVAEDGTVTGVISTYVESADSFRLDLVTVTPTARSAAAQRQVIRLAAMDVDPALQQQVIDFNRRSDSFRIEITDYSVYGSNQDGTSGGETILNTEILSGTVPDIICLNSLNYRKLSGMGILEDLYPYIDADPALSRSDFFPNVLAAREVDGKLCSTVPGFCIRSVIGAASVVGDTPGWTYDDFRAALASMPSGCAAFGRNTARGDILTTCLELDMADFVDWEDGLVRFDSPAFIALLEFAASLPAEEDPEYGDGLYDDTGERLAQGRQMLVETGTCGLEDILFNNYAQYLGGRITYIGYPTAHGSGNMFSFDEEPACAMCSGSAHKDAVWEFLRVFFTKDYQSGELSSLPSRTDVFEAKAAEAATVRYQKNDEGRIMLDAKGERIPLPRYFLWNAETKRREPVYAVSPEQIAQVRALIRSTAKSGSFDLSILNIAEEQAAPFFAGQRSAAEVARLVQSKVSLYVGEQF